MQWFSENESALRIPEFKIRIQNRGIEEYFYKIKSTWLSFQHKARKLPHQLQVENFKASSDWCTKFMRRQRFSLKRKTSIYQKFPAEYDLKLTEFHQHFIKMRSTHDYDFMHIGNADETPIYFDMPRNYTIHSRGAKEVKILTTG